MTELYENDLKLIKERGVAALCGIDEAGRGALAGPVVIAGVVLDYGFSVESLNDSKQLSPKKRRALYEEITLRALAYEIVALPVSLIDEINILQATLQGFQMIYKKLKSSCDYALIDGRDLPSGIKGEAVIGGDHIHACIAAASILAKVYRDDLMIDLDNIYPEYGFAAHKGYGTKKHYEALAAFGACKEHRQSFRLF
ncbi:MAG TPA: ribonuclease HII [Candidatus Cloacimonetes bacterium]|nr:ribonuclease HII [Candidatus Cloacimonadota bacterium]